MKQNNKGYILVLILIIFSIIITVVTMCISITYKNSLLIDLKLQEIELSQASKSGIKLVESNILNELELQEDKIKDSEEFKRYFRGNEFIDKIKSISSSNLTNIKIEVNLVDENNDNVCLDIKSISNKNKYSKSTSCNIEIVNTFKQVEDESNEELIKILYE